MSQPSDTFDSYDAKGNRQALVNMIYRTKTEETPFLSAIAKIKTTNTLHEWQTDDLGSASTNYTIEADEATTDASVATTRLGNYCQISDKVALVSGTQIAGMNPAGRTNEMDYQMSKRSLQLRKDVELALLDNNAKVAGNASTARECAGVPAWITTNYDKNGATNPTGDGTDAWSGGTNAALTEGRLKSVLQQAWSNGGNPDMILANAFNKQVISGFSGNGTRYIMADANKLDTAYAIYASDFGELKVVPSRHCETNMVYVLDTSLWKYAVLRDFQINDLAVNGDYQRKQLLVEFTLEACNEKGNGIIVNVSPS